VAPQEPKKFFIPAKVLNEKRVKRKYGDDKIMTISSLKDFDNKFFSLVIADAAGNYQERRLFVNDFASKQLERSSKSFSFILPKKNGVIF
jgi:hypothetical protein